MKKLIGITLGIMILWHLQIIHSEVFAEETAQELFNKGQAAYNSGQTQQALDYFEHATVIDKNHIDSYFNIGAIYFNLKRYPEALEAFNKLLQIDPNESVARYETGRIYEKMGRIDEAIAAFEIVPATSPRYSKAQETISRLQALKKNSNKPIASETKPDTVQSLTDDKNNRTSITDLQSSHKQKSSILSEKITPATNVQEFATGFAGPTGIAVDPQGILYVANFSKNTIYKVNPAGEKYLLASGSGINGPVGITLDNRTGDLYVANHLDNTIAKISQDGKISIVATGLKKPYNIFFDELHRMLYVSQQETNSIAKIKLN